MTERAAESLEPSPLPGRSEQVAAAVEEEIALGRLYPRERLTEDELIARYDVKRHVARSALRELEVRGAVERRANVGAFVRAWSAQEVVDLYDVRELLEVHCARSIATPMSEDRLAELVEAQEQHDHAVDANDPRAAVRANLRFHHTFFGLSENALLVDAVRRHAQMAYAIRSVLVTSHEHLRRARDEHWAMLRALREGDTDALAVLCAQHLAPSRDAYLQRLGAVEG